MPRRQANVFDALQPARYARGARWGMEVSVQLLGYVVFATALIFVVLHRNAAKAYLAAYRAAHRGATPGIEWLTQRDPDPEVERLRVRRLLAVIPASVLVMAGIVMVAFAPT